MFLRYLFGTRFALPMFLAQQRRLPPMEVLRAHLLRSVAVVITATTFFYALGALPLGGHPRPVVHLADHDRAAGPRSGWASGPAPAS